MNDAHGQPTEQADSDASGGLDHLNRVGRDLDRIDRELGEVAGRIFQVRADLLNVDHTAIGIEQRIARADMELFKLASSDRDQQDAENASLRSQLARADRTLALLAFTTITSALANILLVVG